MNVRWSRRAQEDLLRIGRYIAKDNRVAARRMVERLRLRARQAAEHPRAGRMVPEHARPELREVLLRSYRLVYRIDDEAIEVLTVFEGHHLFPEGVASDAPDDEG